jgi:hypothetical protein
LKRLARVIGFELREQVRVAVVYGFVEPEAVLGVRAGERELQHVTARWQRRRRGERHEPEFRLRGRNRQWHAPPREIVQRGVRDDRAERVESERPGGCVDAQVDAGRTGKSILVRIEGQAYGLRQRHDVAGEAVGIGGFSRPDGCCLLQSEKDHRERGRATQETREEHGLLLPETRERLNSI